MATLVIKQWSHDGLDAKLETSIALYVGNGSGTELVSALSHTLADDGRLVTFELWVNDTLQVRTSTR